MIRRPDTADSLPLLSLATSVPTVLADAAIAFLQNALAHHVEWLSLDDEAVFADL